MKKAIVIDNCYEECQFLEDSCGDEVGDDDQLICGLMMMTVLESDLPFPEWCPLPNYGGDDDRR